MAGESIRTVTGVVETETGNYVHLDGTPDYWPFHTIQPVVLSKVIVEACGFEDSEDGLWYEYLNVAHFPIFLMVLEGKWDFSLTDPRDVAYWKRIHYLHQLQNLFFALNNEDLRIGF